MKQYCLIGERLDYSLSPLMHNSLFSLAGMDASYHNLECKPDELEAVAQRLRREYSGANVTVPYKTAIIPYLDEITGNAKQCGAVNTIINRDGRLIGDCTDGEGFVKALGMDYSNTIFAPASHAASSTARRSTSVTPEGMHTKRRGREKKEERTTCLIK